MSKPSPLFCKLFRSNFEAQICHDLTESGFDYLEYYERTRLSYVVPERTATYLPDLMSRDGRLIIELKGRFTDVAERMKYVHFAACHPDIELRFVLQRAGVPIYKRSRTTQEAWLRDHGFAYAIGAIPADWLTDLTR